MTQQPPGYPPQQPQFPQHYQQVPYQQQQPPQQQQPYPQQGYQQQGYQQPGYPPPGHPAAPPGRPQDVPRVAPAWSPYPVLVSTMNDLPGHQVDQVFGHVFGLTVRTGNVGANFAAGFRALGGGEVHEFTQMVAEWRHVAVTRMCQMAQGMGANAVLAMRFDCNDVAQMAYGTAVVVRPPAGEDEPAGESAEPPGDAAVE